MKANRYLAILVFLGSAAWIATGEFSSVGSAADAESATPAAETAAPEDAGEDAKPLQTVGVAVIPQLQHARSVKISGVTKADKVTTLTARAGGIIGELLIKQGAAVKEGDVIEVRDKSKQLAVLLEATQLPERDVPDYIDADHSKMTATFVRTPGLGDVPYPVMMEPNLVVEFYAKN